MYYITLDLEWNQAYAQQSIAVQKRLCCRLRGEVIQIGAVKLDRNLNLCGSYSVIVKPKYFKKLHRHVSELTGITQDQMNQGIPLPEAAEAFRKWCGEDFAFLTWGPDDIPMLKENLNAHGISGDWLESTYDLQLIFNRELNDGKKQRSLEYAMEHFGIPMTLPAHDALNDAYFTALVAARLEVPRQIRENVGRKNADEVVQEIGNADIGEDGYPTLESLLLIPAFTEPVCVCCGKALTTEDEVLHAKGQRYSRLYTCAEHGSFLYTLHPVKNFDETWRARLRVIRASEADITKYRERLKLAVARRPYRRHRRKPKQGQAKPTENVNNG